MEEIIPIDETICITCGEKLDQTARDAGREDCFSCYSEREGSEPSAAIE